MRMHPFLVFLFCLSTAAGAAGQEIRSNEWSRGTTLNGFAGLAGDANHAGPIVGGVVAWEITRWVAIEGAGSWLELGRGTTGFGGSLNVRGRLKGRGRVDPYVVGGVGLYRARVGRGDDPAYFYRRRLTAEMTRMNPAESVFTDPSLVGGGGLEIHVNRHLALRPDVQATFVIRDGRHHVMAAMTLHAVYHFEHHPVTPVLGSPRSR